VISGGGTLLLGVNENIDIQPAKLALGPGDVVLFVSDGIVENQDVEGRLYGTDRLENFLRKKRGEPVSELVASILNEWRTFSKETKQSDDGTILALQIKN
ncbi:MAG: PP2C family protein-serine/threonine phosphatase, partial [Planctomycetota bacterium]